MRKAFALLAAYLAATAVTAARGDRGITDTAEASYDKASGITTLTIRLAKNDMGFSLSTRWRAKPFEAVATHQKLSGWKGNYFFVRDNCLIEPDDKAPWRCVREHVFTLLDEGKRLAYLGAVFAGEDCIEEQKFGCSLYQDVFTDVYDALEKNTLAAREDSPAPLLALRVKDGAWIADLEETWKDNQERYRAGAKCIAAPAEERKKVCAEGITPLRALLFNLTLMRYTRHEDAYASIRAQAREIVCSADQRPCEERLRALDNIMTTIASGGVPAKDGRVVAIKAGA